MRHYLLVDDNEAFAENLAEIGARPEQMPTIVGDFDVAGHIRGGVHGSGLADAWAEATVAGINTPGDVMVICGTTLIVWCVLPAPVLVPGMWSIPHPLGHLAILGGASNGGAMFVNWVRRLLAGTGSVTDPRAVPVFVPYLKGERTPVHDIDLRASVQGLDIGHDASSIMRSAYEATAFVARRMMELSGVEQTRIVASGGGTHDEQWMRALADCTGLPVDLVSVPEGAALIPNRMSGAPGIKIGNVHLMAGVPHITAQMLDALTGTLEGGAPLQSATVGGFIPESEVAGILRETERAHPQCQIGSYPFFKEGRVGANFVIRSTEQELLDRCAEALVAALGEAGYQAVIGGI